MAALCVPIGLPGIAKGQEIAPVPINSDGDSSGKNLAKNPDFQSGLDRWIRMDSSGKLQASVEERNGCKAVKMSYEPPAEIGWPAMVQDLNLTPGKAYTMSVDIDVKNTRDGAGPYFVMEYLDATGKRLALSDGELPILKPGTWTTGTGTIRVPVAAAKMRINLILHGFGTAWFSNVMVKEYTPPDNATLAKEVNARIASKPNQHPLVGIGFEDDGYSYTKGNLQHGENEASLALREERIRWLKPGFVRMFVWMGEWLPAGFFKTTTPAAYLWESDFMISKIRTLQQYQALGTQVDITGVAWGGPGYLGPMWQDPARVARVYADLLEYLVKTRGLTCIRHFTLSNEPNVAFGAEGGTFADFVAIHRLLKQELAARKLDVSLIGSDDANDPTWFAKCVESEPSGNSVGVFSSHTYLKQYELNPAASANFFKVRMDVLARLSPEKPLIVGEFGFMSEEATAISNPLMKTYDYALHTTDFMLQGLSNGVSGFSIWVLHQVYYPSAATSEAVPLMSFGMWDYKATPGSVHPVYHAMANFTRSTASGDAVTPVTIDGEFVRACIVGKTLLWVNLRTTPVTFNATGFTPTENTTYSEKTLKGERECGTLAPIKDGTCELAPRSFGRMKVDVMQPGQ
jgi:hypothetical protein